MHMFMNIAPQLWNCCRAHHLQRSFQGAWEALLHTTLVIGFPYICMVLPPSPPLKFAMCLPALEQNPEINPDLWRSGHGLFIMSKLLSWFHLQHIGLYSQEWPNVQRQYPSASYQMLPPYPNLHVKYGKTYNYESSLYLGRTWKTYCISSKNSVWKW